MYPYYKSYDSYGNMMGYSPYKDGAFATGAEYRYDGNNRLTKVTYDKGYASYTYDENNNLTKSLAYDNSLNFWFWSLKRVDREDIF